MKVPMSVVFGDKENNLNFYPHQNPLPLNSFIILIITRRRNWIFKVKIFRWMRYLYDCIHVSSRLKSNIVRNIYHLIFLSWVYGELIYVIKCMYNTTDTSEITWNCVNSTFNQDSYTWRYFFEWLLYLDFDSMSCSTYHTELSTVFSYVFKGCTCLPRLWDVLCIMNFTN